MNIFAYKIIVIIVLMFYYLLDLLLPEDRDFGTVRYGRVTGMGKCKHFFQDTFFYSLVSSMHVV